jgi:hypothetical protein
LRITLVNRNGFSTSPPSATSWARADRDRFSVLLRNLLRYVAETLEAAPLSIANLRSLYERPYAAVRASAVRIVLAWATSTGPLKASLKAMLALHAAEAAHRTSCLRRRALGSMSTAF